MTPYYERSEWPAFLAAIRAAPTDDLPRLVAADFVEENGDAERAEFIRVQVEVERVASELETLRAKNANHIDVQTQLIQLRQRQRVLLHADVTHQRGSGYKWSRWESWLGADRVQCPDGYNWFSRGFVTRVSAPLAVLYGGQCRNCVGVGNNSELVGYDAGPCPRCGGSGRTPGVLGELLRREPLTAAGIDVSDREPSLNTTGNVCWFHEDVPHGSRETPDERRRYELATLPADVFDATPPQAGDQKHSRCQWYKSADAARLALGEALYRLHGPKSEVLT